MLRRLLHQEGVERWRDGWALAERMGPAAGAVLHAELRQETNALQRLLLIGAIAAAGGELDRDQWLLNHATAKSRGDEEATLALLCLALAPAGTTAPTGWGDLLAVERRGSAVQVAAVLAASRFGVKATLELRNPSPLEQAEQAMLGAVTAEGLRRAHAAGVDGGSLDYLLVLRAAFLAPPALGSDVVRDAALEVLRDPALARTVRGAAGLHLAAVDPGAVQVAGLDPGARLALATEPAARLMLWGADVLTARPEVLADRATRLPLAVAYALVAPWNRVVADLQVVAREPLLNEAIALALAWRALDEADRNSPPTKLPARWWAPLADTAGAFWLATVFGEPADSASVQAASGRDARLVQLAAQGRLGPAELGAVVENQLWRLGAHPGGVRHTAWCDLVRDLLLSGSDQVSARLQLSRRPSLPAGIENSNSKYFLVADQLSRFLTERGPGPPAALRLRSRTARR